MPKTNKSLTQKCFFCDIGVDVPFCVYKILLKTTKSSYTMGLRRITDLLADWVMKHMYHLSATQLLLFRPDLVNEFFRQYKPNETFVYWKFVPYPICLKCYKDYKKNVPER